MKSMYIALLESGWDGAGAVPHSRFSMFLVANGGYKAVWHYNVASGRFRPACARQIHTIRTKKFKN